MKPAIQVLVVFFGLGWGVVGAVIPPLTPNQREQGADLIVEGLVLSTSPVGKMTHDHCYGWQKYDSEVLVKKVWKGGPVPRTIVVSYSTKVEDQQKCVGGQDSYYLPVGERFKLYLAKGGQPDTFIFFNWTCLENAPRKRRAMDRPWKLARSALQAYRKRDLKAYNKLLTDPFDGIPASTVFDRAGTLKRSDRIRGLFYLDEHKNKMVALIRKKSAKGKALWFLIERVRGGFSVVALIDSNQNPPTRQAVKAGRVGR